MEHHTSSSIPGPPGRPARPIGAPRKVLALCAAGLLSHSAQAQDLTASHLHSNGEAACEVHVAWPDGGDLGITLARPDLGWRLLFSLSGDPALSERFFPVGSARDILALHLNPFFLRAGEATASFTYWSLDSSGALEDEIVATAPAVIELGIDGGPKIAPVLDGLRSGRIALQAGLQLEGDPAALAAFADCARAAIGPEADLSSEEEALIQLRAAFAAVLPVHAETAARLAVCEGREPDLASAGEKIDEAASAFFVDPSPDLVDERRQELRGIADLYRRTGAARAQTTCKPPEPSEASSVQKLEALLGEALHNAKMLQDIIGNRSR